MESFDQKIFYRLALFPIQRVALVADTGEVYLCKVDAANRVVVGSFEIYSATSKVDCLGPLRGTWHIGSFTYGVLDSDGDIEVVEQVKRLQYTLLACGLHRGCGSEKCCSHEA